MGSEPNLGLMNDHRVFQVGGHTFIIDFPYGMLHEKDLKPYTPFQTYSYCGKDTRYDFGEGPLFRITLIDDAEILSSEETVTASFDNDGGRIAVYIHGERGMMISLDEPGGIECCRMRISKDFREAEAWIGGSASQRCYALDTALMLLYAFASSNRDTLLIHASAIEYESRGYIFLGKSGTGKSTHSRLWLEHVKGSQLLNDDNPILRIIDGEVYVYGSPWSGKTPCYLNRKIRLGGIVRLHQAHFNKITPLTGVKAYAALQPSCSYMSWDKDMASAVHDTLCRIMERTPIFSLDCLPNSEAPLICKEVLE